MKKYFLFIFSLMFLAACRNSQNLQQYVAGDTLTLKHAKGFRITYDDKYKKIEVADPWNKGKFMGCYYLVHDTQTVTPNDGVKIKIPLNSVALTSTTQIEFLNLLGELSTVSGMASPSLVYNDQILDMVEKKQTVDLGDALNLNMETLLFLHPDIVMLSGYGGHKDRNKFSGSNVSAIVYNNEWMEPTLLARAEWLKFVAAFYDKESLADSLFRQIEQRYVKLQKAVDSVRLYPSVLLGSSFKGTWYMPSGKSYMGQLMADAGTSYFYAEDTTRGSLPLSFEKVLYHFQKADFWFGAQADNLSELMTADPRYALFEAVKNRHVYGFNARTRPSGANDFWEGAVAHPDLILADLIKVLHPNLLPERKLFYIKKLE